MTKRKLLLVALSLCMVAILAMGTTLAYLTDTDAKDNVFTVGKVDITLNDDFVQDSKLTPGTDIEKNVTITNESTSEEAWVWYTYAIPTALDNDDASKNVIHVNHAGQNWEDYFTPDNKNGYEGTATKIEETWKVDWKVEKNVKIGDIEYNVYTALYNGKLAPGATTTLGMTKVYMDTHVNQIDGKWYWEENGVLTEIDYDLSAGVTIPVTAYGIQAIELDNVEEAYAAYWNQKAAN